MRVQLDGALHFQSVPPLLPAYNTYMSGEDRLSQVKKKSMDFIENLDDMDTSFFCFLIFIMPLIMSTFVSCKLFHMPPKDF